MRNLLYAIIASLATSLFFCLNCSADEPDELLHTQCLYPTIHVSQINKEGYGSGFIVRSSKISKDRYLNVFLTAAHVASSYDHKVKVFEYEDWSLIKRTHTYPATIYAADNTRDIAIGMFISDEKMPVTKIDMDSKLYIGSQVFHVGCGLGEDPRLDYGKITSLRSKIGGAGDWMLRTSVFSIPGDSGGALFNSKYRAIGMLKSIRHLRTGQLIFNMSYYTPLTCLRDWSEEESGAYDFVWKERAFPRMPFWELHFSYDYLITKVP